MCEALSAGDVLSVAQLLVLLAFRVEYFELFQEKAIATDWLVRVDHAPVHVMYVLFFSFIFFTIGVFVFLLFGVLLLPLI